MLLCMLLVYSTTSELRGAEVVWLTNYENAVSQAKENSQPIVLFFTGSDWCTWCHKLENEALDTDEFAEEAANEFVFLKLDFPMKTQQDPDLIDQNKELQQKYDVRTFPSIIILDSNEQQVGITGYRPGGGKQYAEHLKKMVEEYTSYQTDIKQVGVVKVSGTELKYLYRKAKEYNRVDDQIKIVKEGVSSDRAHFFMIERYRFLASEGHIRSKEAVSLKKHLRESDPTNRYLTHYQLACIEFDAFADEMNKENYSPDLAVAPLVDYINRFGESDHDNLWRINMIISQVYCDQSCHQKALQYAQCAFDCAPDTTKEEIALVIENIKSDDTPR